MSIISVHSILIRYTRFRTTWKAEKRSLPYSRELTLYIAHGFLHAAGYDDLQPELKRKMRRAERRVMEALPENMLEIFKLANE